MHTKYVKNTLKRHTLANKPHFPMKECKQITALIKKKLQLATYLASVLR